MKFVINWEFIFSMEIRLDFMLISSKTSSHTLIHSEKTNQFQRLFIDLFSLSFFFLKNYSKVDVPNTTNGNSNNSKQPQQTHSETRSGEVKFNSLSKVISTIPTSSFDPPAIYWSIRSTKFNLK